MPSDVKLMDGKPARELSSAELDSEIQEMQHRLDRAKKDSADFQLELDSLLAVKSSL